MPDLPFPDDEADKPPKLAHLINTQCVAQVDATPRMRCTTQMIQERKVCGTSHSRCWRRDGCRLVPPMSKHMHTGLDGLVLSSEPAHHQVNGLDAGRAENMARDRADQAG